MNLAHLFIGTAKEKNTKNFLKNYKLVICQTQKNLFGHSLDTVFFTDRLIHIAKTV